MKTFRVVSSSLNATTNNFELVKEIINDDDSITYNLHTFGRETLEWYAAVYDTTDVDELLGYIVHEPFLPEHSPMKATAADSKAALKAHMEPLKARAKMAKASGSVIKQRMTAAGIPQGYVDQIPEGDDDPLAAVRQYSYFNPKTLAMKREHIAEQRREVQRQEQPTSEDRVDQLRKQLRKDTGRTVPVPAKQGTTTNTVKVVLRKGQKPQHQ